MFSLTGQAEPATPDWRSGDQWVHNLQKGAENGYCNVFADVAFMKKESLRLAYLAASLCHLQQCS